MFSKNLELTNNRPHQIQRPPSCTCSNTPKFDKIYDFLKTLKFFSSFRNSDEVQNQITNTLGLQTIRFRPNLTSKLQNDISRNFRKKFFFQVYLCFWTKKLTNFPTDIGGKYKIPRNVIKQ